MFWKQTTRKVWKVLRRNVVIWATFNTVHELNIDKLSLRNQDSQVSVTKPVEVASRWIGMIYDLSDCRRNSIWNCGKRQEITDNNCNVQHWSGKPMFYYRLVEGNYNDFNNFDFHSVYAQLNMNLWS